MASTLASNERIWGTYTSDDGEDFNISVKKALVAGGGNDAVLGYTAGAAAQANIPNGFRPRRVKCVDASGNARWVICYTTAATLWSTPGTTIQLNYKGVDTQFTSTKKRLGERQERGITKAA